MCKFIKSIVKTIIFTIFIFSFVLVVYGTPKIPEIINVGLNYGSSMFHNINIKSKSSTEIVFKAVDDTDEVISFSNPIDLSFRKDLYYNINDGDIKKIQFIKAVKYYGELIGPYHIQIGNKYPDYNSAKAALPSIVEVLGDAYLVYDKGWKIWSQLYLDKNQCIEQIKAMEKSLPDAGYTVIEPDDNRIQVVDSYSGKVIFLYTGKEMKIIAKDQDKDPVLLEYNGTKYRGNIILKIQEDGSIGVINRILFDYYLYSVVASESSPSWPIEALKAQAVAARNYAMLNIGKHEKNGYNLCNTQHCQVYKGYDKEHKNTNEAVEQTKGKLLLYEGEIAQTFYHSSSGGHTENSENIWSEMIPYIRGVEDSYSFGSPNDNWVAELEKEVISDKLIENSINIGEVIDIVPLEFSEYGRVKKIGFIGSKNSTILEKEKIRYVLGTSNIKSIWYDVKTESDINIFDMNKNDVIIKKPNGLNILSASGLTKINPNDKSIIIKGLFNSKQYNVVPDKYIFTGKGWGHGLGMSQYGAKGMAEKGYSYGEILEYYYKGTKVQ